MKRRKHTTRSRSAKAKERMERGKPRDRQGGPKRTSSTRERFSGRVQKNPKGFAFIISQTPGAEDAYVSREDARNILNNDIVEYTLHRGGGRTSARVERVLRRGQTEIVGRVEGQGQFLGVVTNEGDWMALSGEGKAPRKGEWVRAKIEQYPEGENPGEAVLTQSFGASLLPKHDTEIAIARFNLPHVFSERARHDAAAGYADVEGSKRKDHRDKPFVTIDGEDAKDFDDAILIETNANGFTLYVAIADVSHYVRRGTQLDREALARATSVYFPGTVVPMLPEELSNDLCSLRPREDKRCLTAEIEFDSRGRSTGHRFYENLIRTFSRLTYKNVHEFFEEKKPLPGNEPERLAEMMTNARKLFKLLLLERKRRGVLDFDLPECRMTLDENGFPAQMGPAARWDSHKLIEEFMIAANREVARALRENKVGALYRVHETPKPEALGEINQLLGTLGLAQRLSDLKPTSIAALLDATRHLPGAATLHKAVLRSQRQAHYEPEPKGHFGLALRDYCHFTSPIRRYPDLVVHRALKHLIYKRKSTDKESVDEDTLAQMGEETSERERRAMEAERFVTRRKQCWYLSRRLGEVYAGTISGVVKSGLFVELSQIAADGFLPIEALDGFYEFDQKGHCLRKRPGNSTLAVGGPMRVQVVRVDVDAGEVTLGLAEAE